MTGRANTPSQQPGQHGDPSERTADPSRANLWHAVLDLALRWAATPVLRRFTPDLPRNADQRSRGIPGRLQEMEAAGVGISRRPLRLTQSVQLMQRMPQGPLSRAAPDPQKWQAWLATAAAVEVAHGLMTAWLRSRMPGYPNLPAPQLAPGAPLTVDGYDQPLPWTRDERRQGLQFRDPPPEITRRLEAAPQDVRQIADATRVLGVALQGSSEWQRMGAVADALTDSARAELRQAGRTVSERLRGAEVQKFSAREHLEYRADTLERVLAALSDSAAEYTKAFEAANRLLEIAATEVFGQLAVYGQPVSVSNPQDIDLTPGAYGQLVSFTRPLADEDETQFHLETGQLVWLDNELITDCVRLTRCEISVGPMGERQRYTGTILAETRQAWIRQE